MTQSYKRLCYWRLLSPASRSSGQAVANSTACYIDQNPDSHLHAPGACMSRHRSCVRLGRALQQYLMAQQSWALSADSSHGLPYYRRCSGAAKAEQAAVKHSGIVHAASSIWRTFAATMQLSKRCPSAGKAVAVTVTIHFAYQLPRRWADGRRDIAAMQMPQRWQRSRRLWTARLLVNGCLDTESNCTAIMSPTSITR